MMGTVLIVILLVGCVFVDANTDVVIDELADVIKSLDAGDARSVADDDELSPSTADAYMYRNKESCAVKNVAINKPAKASSTYSQYSLPSLLVDGNREQRFFGSPGGSKTYCFTTKTTPHINKWWYVDLKQRYTIERLKFYNRIDCCPERAEHFQILVGDTLDEMNEVGYVETMGATQTVTLPKNTRGRYVKLFQAVKGIFHMCEVEVYAIPENCRSQCQNGGILSQDSSCGHKCVCPAYRDYRYLGANCEEIWIKLPDNPTYNLVPRT